MIKSICVFSMLLCAAVGVSAQDITTSLELYLPLNGDADDKSGNNRHGYLRNGPKPTEDINGYEKQAYQFDGVDDWLALPVPFDMGSTAFTFSLQFKLDDLPSRSGNNADFQLFKVNTGANVSDALYIDNDDGLKVYSTAREEKLVILDAVETDKWYKVVMTYDGIKELKVYVDGELELSDDDVDLDSIATVQTIRMFDDFYGAYGKGTLDEIRIYKDRVLTDDDIKMLDSVVLGSLQDEVATNDIPLIYPNPVADYLNISLNDKSTIEVYTLTGSLVKTWLSIDESQLFVGDLLPGAYVVKLSGGDGEMQSIEKLIKE